ncbi:amino acid ABC transporter ATP-binding protein [Rhodospirillaceae bacterium SYSU D60014]|uniref:amino acid ABC transporter ATP-binding protein n=1 Tax=Virgifigura deserti TaxID=2268457 RepID=UPI000E671B31
MSTVLRVESIVKRYSDHAVLNGVSLELARGEAKVIMGPSGTGKSTLLRCINHLTPPDEGRVFLEGEELTSENINKIRQRLAFVFQDFNLFLHLTVLDNVRIGPRRILGQSKEEATERALTELRRVGLEDRANYYPAQLSGGQQQRASIARALAMDPKVILFDEPTSALDPELTGEVVAVMKQLASEGMTMLVVSHEVAFARSAADKIIFMEGGYIVEEATPEVILRNPRSDRTRGFLKAIGEQEAV